MGVRQREKKRREREAVVLPWECDRERRRGERGMREAVEGVGMREIRLKLE